MKGTNLECDEQYGVRAGDETQIMCRLEGGLCSPELRGEDCPIKEGEDDGTGSKGENKDTYSL